MISKKKDAEKGIPGLYLRSLIIPLQDPSQVLAQSGTSLYPPYHFLRKFTDYKQR